ncbi:MAG: Ig-like domain-containing protein, partial [Terriglobia bacterium]
QLRDSQKEDFRKNKIPLSATDGIVKWVRLDNVPVIGQFIGLNRAQKSVDDASQKRNVGGNHSPTSPNLLITPEIYGDCPCPSDYQEIYVPSPICWRMMFGDTCAWTSSGEWVSCQGDEYFFDVTFDSSWSSSNTSVATVDYTALVTAVWPGSSTINAQYADFFYSGPRCATRLDSYGGGGAVTVRPTVRINGAFDFAFVGTDPTIPAVSQQAIGNPPNSGTYVWTASPSTRVSFDTTTSAVVGVHGINPSTAVRDTTINVQYTVNGVSNSASRSITSRIFFYLGPVVKTCYTPQGLYGYDCSAYYNVYTHPDRNVLPTICGGISVYESVNIQHTNFPGSHIQSPGRLNIPAQVTDELAIISTQPLPAGIDEEDLQDLGVGGFFVRNNTLHYTSIGVTITSNGPSQ